MLPSVSVPVPAKLQETLTVHVGAVKSAVGDEFDGPVLLPPQAASSAAAETKLRTREERIVLVPSPRVKVRCRCGKPAVLRERPGAGEARPVPSGGVCNGDTR